MDSIKTGETRMQYFMKTIQENHYLQTGEAKDLTVIDPAKQSGRNHTTYRQVETAVSDGAGKVFVNNEDKKRDRSR